MGLKATLSIRPGFVGHYLATAARFARVSANIEKQYTSKTLSEDLRSEHLAGVQAAVLFSVASMETCVNELYADAREKNRRRFGTEMDGAMNLLAELWPVINKPTILPKYQVALVACEKPAFDTGMNPYQDIDSLIVLRNALVHFEPEWDTNQLGHKKIEDRLRGKFELSPFVATANAFFPWHCLSHGCAAWAVRATESFINAFFDRLELKSPLSRVLGGELHTSAD
jgi:hypothetical protein